MADISTHIENIQKASRGEAVRDSIIEALKAVNELGTNANTLDGHPAEDFVTAASLQTSMETIGNTIDTINGVVINGGVSTKLAETTAAKKEIEAAITSKGVSIPANSSFKSYGDLIKDISGSSDLESIDITQNGDYDAQAEGITGWKSIHVDVTEGMTDLTVTQNGTYTAETEGVTGFKSVTVNVAAPVGSSGPFTVRFMSEDGATILRTVTGVRGGGYAEYTGPTPVSSVAGLSFSGWDPSPYNIQSDTYCYPVFVDPGAQVAGEISDSWDTIIANEGRGYAIGSYKTIALQTSNDILIPYADYNTRGTIAGKMCSVKKVYEGEGGTGSTWVMYGIPQITPYTVNAAYCKRYHNGCNWIESEYREWLNGEFLSKMMPKSLRNGIRSVLKYTWCWDDDAHGYRQMSSVDKLWLPSFRELHMSNQAAEEEIISEGYSETGGPEYYKNNTNLQTRCMYPAGNNGLPVNTTQTRIYLRSGGKSDPSTNYGIHNKSLESNGIINGDQLLRIDGNSAAAINQYGPVFGFCL